MNISALFIGRPIATCLLAIGILLLGIVAFLKLPIASLPAVERPTITVSASLPGASADTIASALAQPLERQLAVIPGIVEMASYSAAGGTQITIQFELSKDIDAAAGEVQQAINAAGPGLPKDLPSPPSYRKANPSGFAPIALALTSDAFTPGEVYNYADSIIGQKLATINGVARVIVTGGDKTAIRIQASPQQMANMDISLERLRLAVRAATLKLPKGSINIGDQTLGIETNDQLMKPDEYRNLVLAYRNGSPIRLDDVAKVSDSVINDKTAGWFNYKRAVLIFVLKQPDANVVEIADAVKAMLPKLQGWLPSAIKANLLYDRTQMIRASIIHVGLTIQVATVFLVIVMAVFLRHVWAVVIPVLAIPIVLGATMVGMKLLGFSLDNLSLMALIIAIGFVVDDAIIVIENIKRGIDENEDATEASLRGTKRIGFTIVAITASMLASLLPIMLMPDVIGRYFWEFGATLVLAIVASAVISLTLIPALCCRLLGARRRSARAGKSSATFGLLVYLRSLDWMLSRPALCLVIISLTLAGSAGLFIALPKAFLPTQDIGLFSLRTVTVANVSFPAMERLQRTVASAVLEDPAVDGLSSFIGTDNGSSLSTGTMYVNLKPLEVRREPIGRVINRLRRSLAGIAGVRCFFTPWQDLVLGVENTAARYQYTLTGSDPAELWRWAAAMRRRMLAMPEVTDVISSAEISGLEANVRIDRKQAAALGLTMTSIDNTLYDAFGQRWAKIIYLPSDFSEVILDVDPAVPSDPSAFANIFVPRVGRGQVPLSQVAQLGRTHAAMWIRHSDQFPSITLSFDTRPGFTIGDAIASIREAQSALNLPDEIRAEFRGEAEEATKSRSRETLLLLGAVVSIYIVLGMLYESYVHPFTILTVLPSATFGALLMLTITRTEFTLIAAVGCILVVGMVMKNAIMMIDFAIAARRHDNSATEAIRLAAELRFRPILMTSLVTILGGVALAVGPGAGIELRQPLGLATIGGLLTSQLLTLYTTPGFYVLVDRLPGRLIDLFSRRRTGSALSG